MVLLNPNINHYSTNSNNTLSNRARQHAGALQSKFLLVGDSGVGKSCLRFMFTESKFETNYSPTLGLEYASKTIHLQINPQYSSTKIQNLQNPKKVDHSVLNATAELHVWDVAGAPIFRGVSTLYYKTASAVLLVYDVTEWQSFLHLKKLVLDFVRPYAPDTAVIALVGNKRDLVETNEGLRGVTEEEARAFANAFGIHLVFEVSAKTGHNVDAVFLNTAASLIRERLERVGDDNNIKAPLEAYNINTRSATINEKKPTVPASSLRSTLPPHQPDHPIDVFYPLMRIFCCANSLENARSATIKYFSSN